MWKRLNAEEPQDGIDLGGKYEDLLKGANKKIINFLGKQGELLKRFRDEDKFFDRVGLSQSNIYFKIVYINSYENFYWCRTQLSHPAILKLILK